MLSSVFFRVISNQCMIFGSNKKRNVVFVNFVFLIVSQPGYDFVFFFFGLQIFYFLSQKSHMFGIIDKNRFFKILEGVPCKILCS